MNLLILLIIISLIILFTKNKKENFTKIESCKYIPTLFHQVMKENNLNDNDIYVPCTYNTCETDIIRFENEPATKIYMIDGCDVLASKLELWRVLRNYFGKNANKYMPTTYLLEDKDDIINFPKHFEENKKQRPNHMYVLKNYEQRQEGIKLTRNLEEILEGLKQGWYLVQDYLYNPFIISKRKINFRYYLLITCINGKIEAYSHNDGFLYYTPEFYDENDINSKKHITTGYIDRKIYEENALTLEDFREHLDKTDKNLRHVWNKNAENLLKNVMLALSPNICKNKKLNHHIRFELFGCDLAPSNTLEAKLMEINKGPDMNAKDARDKLVKLTVQRDIIKIINNNHNNHKFIKLL